MGQRSKPNVSGSGGIVGVWEVYAPDAPFPWHMMTFTPDHTMYQSNPPEGNQRESDSSGHGVWEAQNSPGGALSYLGKFIEFKARRSDGKHIGKGVILFQCTVHNNTFTGMSVAYQYDGTNQRAGRPSKSAIYGTLIALTEKDRRELL